MISRQEILLAALHACFPEYAERCSVSHQEVTLEVPADKLYPLALALRDEPSLLFSMLIDLCAVDYLSYGMSEWITEDATTTGFDRAVVANTAVAGSNDKPRFAVVYHLLSVVHNYRLRLRAYVTSEPLLLDSVIDVWPAANWFEREAFDLFGILFNGHPDLRRILTDYGFVGYPFRKDFPLSGHVQMRYDAALQRVIYEPVDIEPRVLVPRVIRHEQPNQTIAQKDAP